MVAGKYSPLTIEASMAMLAKASILKILLQSDLIAPYPMVHKAIVAEEICMQKVIEGGKSPKTAVNQPAKPSIVKTDRSASFGVIISPFWVR
jgi:hypothetical protein